MSYFYLPRIYGEVDLKNKEITYNNEEKMSSFSLVDYLKKFDNEKKKNKESVNYFKKKYFPYYLLNSINNEINNEIKFNNYLPVHRKFFIFLEILNTIVFIQNINLKNILILNIGDYDLSIKESYLYVFNRTNKSADVHFFSLNKINDLHKEKVIQLKDVSKDLLNKKTLTNIFTHYKKYFHIINCDIKEKNFYKYEKNISLCSYIFINILYSLLMQQFNGYMIIKLPNIFNHTYQEILYFLSSIYEKVIVIKPQICKNLKSEKYIVCKNLIVNCNPYLLYEIISNYIDHFNSNNLLYINKILWQDIPLFYVNKLNECNAILGQQQLEVLNSILNYCLLDKNDSEIQKKEKIKILENKTRDKCINWCVQNNFSLDN